MTAMATTGPRRAALLAGILGARAYRNGKPATACPFGPSRPIVRRAWLTGYSAARKADTGQDLTDLDEASDVGAPWPGDTPAVG